jgi:predicted exporter
MNWLRSPLFWIGLVWLALLLTLPFTLPQSNWNTSVTAALPEAESDWQRTLMRDSQSARQVSIALHGAELSVLRQSAREILALERGVSWQSPGSLARQTHAVYRRYAGQLARPEDWQALHAGNVELLLRRAQQRLYSPVGLGGVPLQQDPLLLTPGFIESGAAGFGSLTAADHWLQGEYEKGPFVLLSGTLDFSAFEQTAALDFSQSLDSILEALGNKHPGLQIDRSGAVFHAVAAAEQARFEISTYGSISLLGIVVLLLVMFRSVRPFLLTGMTLGLASASGLAALLLLFPAPHILAMVFATTLIGIAVDYSFHGMLGVQRGEKGFKAMLPNLRLGLLTSLVGYLTLLVLPFPLLQQVAVFVGTGLVAAYLSVHLLFPRLLRQGKLRSVASVDDAVDRLARRADSIPPRPGLWALYLGAACLLAILYASISVDDEVANFHQSPPGLMAEEASVRSLSQQTWSPSMLVVAGATIEERLQREEQLQPALQELVEQGELLAWRALSQRVPSIERQRAVQSLWRDQAGNAAFAAYLAALELPLPSQLDSFLTPGQLPGTEPHRLQTKQGDYTLIMLQLAEGNRSALQTMADGHEFLAFYSPLQDANDTVAELRSQLAAWLVLAIGLAWLLLCLRRGVSLSTHIGAYLVIALSCSLLVAQLVQGSVNLFNLVAALLVLALALDYAVFITSRVERQDVVKAVALSALTTCLAFGLLSFSFTPVIAAFGISVFAGVAAALLATPLLAAQRRKREE